MKNLFTDAVLLALMSVLGYGIAYTYELGYASHFGFPEYLISPTPSVIAGALFFLSTGAQVLVGFWAIWVEQTSRYARTAIVCFVGTIPIEFAAFMVFSDSQAIGWVLAFGGLLIALIGFGFWRLRLTGANMPVDPNSRTAGVLAAVFAAVLLAVLAQMAGTTVAKAQKTFFVMNADPSYAVVRIYGETIVAVKFDQASQALTGDYLVGKLGADDFKLALKRQRFEKQRRLTLGEPPGNSPDER